MFFMSSLTLLHCLILIKLSVSGMLGVDVAGVETVTAAVGGLEAEAGGAEAGEGGRGVGRVGGRKGAGAGTAVAREADPRARRKR